MPRAVAERADILDALTEVFREHGYDGASMALISKATGLGKGSLYHFFPGGKDEMMTQVLARIGTWFETGICTPLGDTEAADQAIDAMFDAVLAYFQSGRRVCVVGVLAMGDARDRFRTAIGFYFTRWIDALATALRRAGYDRARARAAAEAVVADIQGALVLARALGEPDMFARRIAAIRTRINHRELP